MSSTDLYADDTTFYDIQKNKEMLQSNLNHALHSLNSWCLNNGMQLNTDKTKVLLITTAQRKHALQNCELELMYKDIVLGQSSGERLRCAHSE